MPKTHAKAKVRAKVKPKAQGRRNSPYEIANSAFY
jgi:hypothetical protein